MPRVADHPRYGVVSARVTDAELMSVDAFAADFELNRSSATRKLIEIGLKAVRLARSVNVCSV